MGLVVPVHFHGAGEGRREPVGHTRTHFTVHVVTCSTCSRAKGKVAPCPSCQTYSRQAGDEKWLLSPEPGLVCADTCPSSLPPGHTCSATVHLHVAIAHTRGPQTPPSRLLLGGHAPFRPWTHALVVRAPIRNVEGWAQKLLGTLLSCHRHRRRRRRRRNQVVRRASSLGYAAPEPEKCEPPCAQSRCVCTSPACRRPPRPESVGSLGAEHLF